MIRAKFVVRQVSRSIYGHAVQLQPVTGGTDENRSFFQATPAGQLELGGLKREVVELFGEPGVEFYVDFTPAAEPSPS